MTAEVVNIVFKTSLGLFLGSPAFIRPVVIGFAITFAAGLRIHFCGRDRPQWAQGFLLLNAKVRT